MHLLGRARRFPKGSRGEMETTGTYLTSEQRACGGFSASGDVVGLATSELTVAKLTERHFARTAVRSSLLGALLSPPARPSRLPTTSSAR